MPSRLPRDPGHNQVDDFRLLDCRKLNSPRHLPPLFQTTSATSCRGMLGFENGMTMHRGLTPVISRQGRRKSSANELHCVASHGTSALLGKVGQVNFRQPEPTAELRPSQPFKSFVKSHVSSQHATELQLNSLHYPKIFFQCGSQSHVATQNGLRLSAIRLSEGKRWHAGTGFRIQIQPDGARAPVR